MIYLVEIRSSLAEQIQSLLRPPICPHYSGLVQSECLVGAMKRESKELAEIYETFLRTLDRLPVTDSVWKRAAEIRAKHNLRLPDALHVAIAESGECDQFWTSDRAYLRMKGHTGLVIKVIADHEKQPAQGNETKIAPDESAGAEGDN